MEREYYPLNSIRIHSHWFAPGFSWYRWPRLVVGHLHDRQFDDGQRVCVMYRNEISGAFGVRLTTTRVNKRESERPAIASVFGASNPTGHNWSLIMAVTYHGRPLIELNLSISLIHSFLFNVHYRSMWPPPDWPPSPPCLWPRPIGLAFIVLFFLYILLRHC